MIVPFLLLVGPTLIVVTVFLIVTYKPETTRRYDQNLPIKDRANNPSTHKTKMEMVKNQRNKQNEAEQKIEALTQQINNFLKKHEQKR